MPIEMVDGHPVARSEAEMAAMRARQDAPGPTDPAILRADLTALAARLAALEARPEEAAAFTGSARIPSLAALGSMTLTVGDLVPARTGDVLRKGERISVQPVAPLPAGLVIAAALVPADGSVALQLVSTVSIAAGATDTAWTITALR